MAGETKTLFDLWHIALKYEIFSQYIGLKGDYLVMYLQNIDIKILSVLQHDAAISTSDLAQQVHLSQ